MTRRIFQHLGLLAFGLFYAGGVLFGALKYLRPLPPGRRKERLRVGSLEDFVAGGVKSVEFNGKKVWLLYDGTRVRAFDAECTHLSCNVRWEPADGLFHCPCHGGRFDRFGKPVAGPPPKPLGEFVVLDPGAAGGAVILLDRRVEA